MEKKYVQKRLIIASLVLYNAGVVLAIIGFLIVLQMDVELLPRLLVMLPGVLLAIGGSYIKISKCKCPYCGAGEENKRVYKDYRRIVTINTLRKGSVYCPKCENTIYIQ